MKTFTVDELRAAAVDLSDRGSDDSSILKLMPELAGMLIEEMEIRELKMKIKKKLEKK